MIFLLIIIVFLALIYLSPYIMPLVALGIEFVLAILLGLFDILSFGIFRRKFKRVLVHFPRPPSDETMLKIIRPKNPPKAAQSFLSFIKTKNSFNDVFKTLEKTKKANKRPKKSKPTGTLKRKARLKQKPLKNQSLIFFFFFQAIKAK